MRTSTLQRDRSAQMLLATGLVLILSLLSMSLIAVRIASLGEPYDPAPDESIQTAREIDAVLQPMLENRSRDLRDAGTDWDTAVWQAANSSALDLQRHGDVRGTSIAVRDIGVTNTTGVFTVDLTISVTSRINWIDVPFSVDVDLT